jgi:hypothetical protein
MELDIKTALNLLNFYLNKTSNSRSFTICGGASLFLQGIITRTTRDIDIVGEEIDSVLSEAAILVAKDLGLKPKWLNTEPKSLARDMRSGWEGRIFLIYQDTNLQIFSISREDMIFAKFYAYCDRQKDIEDIISLRATPSEINEAFELTKLKDGNPLWPKHVESQLLKLKKRLGYE